MQCLLCWDNVFFALLLMGDSGLLDMHFPAHSLLLLYFFSFCLVKPTTIINTSCLFFFKKKSLWTFAVELWFWVGFGDSINGKSIVLCFSISFFFMIFQARKSRLHYRRPVRPRAWRAVVARPGRRSMPRTSTAAMCVHSVAARTPPIT